MKITFADIADEFITIPFIFETKILKFSAEQHFLLVLRIFSRCTCRRGLMDAHGQRSSDMIKTSFHEVMSILPLEGDSEVIDNDRTRHGQTYPGSIIRSFWAVMQSSSTRNGMLYNNHFLYLKTNPNHTF